jgi:hypothetical protein
MTMSKPIEKGIFVLNEAHPEYGVGRVLAVETFATRVLFPKGGLRVFRASDTGRLKAVAAPPPPDLELLEEKEAALARGAPDLPVGKSGAVPAAAKPAKKKRAAKAR